MLGLDHGVAVTLEDPAQHGALQRIVFHEHYTVARIDRGVGGL